MSGYGESKRRRASSSRSVDRKEKGRKEKKEKKEKKRRERDRDGDRDRDRDRDRKHKRSRSPRRDKDRDDSAPPAPLGQAPTSDEAILGRAASRADFGEVSQPKRAAWREELDKQEEEEEVDQGADGEEATLDGAFVHVEDDDEVERKLVESRARREALMAKWVNRGESDARQNGSMDGHSGHIEAEGESDGEGEVSEEDRPGETPEVAEAAEEEDEQTLQLKRDLQQFILKHKAEHDNMFEENADEEALRTGSIKAQSAAINQTGASADDWDDSEGYYKAKVGELMAGRYHVHEDMCGKGVFSTVVKAYDQQKKQKDDGYEVAIKVMRCNDMMKAAAEKEIKVLERLNKSDRGNKKHVIKLMRHFLYRGHLCLVFECMWDNLRVALKKYTKDKGMSLEAVRAYSKQLLIALRHLHKCGIIHADIKPDNILISAGHNVVKICDLGSAMELTEVEGPTPYLVSRFYRSPEICLGGKYSFPLDVFAMGCTLFELFTGKILFPGRTNNDMIRLFMEVKGKLPHKTIKNGAFWKQHFDENLDFRYDDTDKATRKKRIRIITDMSAKRPVAEQVMQRVGLEKQKSSDPKDQNYVKKAKQFAELVNQMTALDPDKRVTADDGLKLVFVNTSFSQDTAAAKAEPTKDGKDGKDAKAAPKAGGKAESKDGKEPKKR